MLEKIFRKKAPPSHNRPVSTTKKVLISFSFVGKEKWGYPHKFFPHSLHLQSRPHPSSTPQESGEKKLFFPPSFSLRLHYSGHVLSGEGGRKKKRKGGLLHTLSFTVVRIGGKRSWEN